MLDVGDRVDNKGGVKLVKRDAFGYCNLDGDEAVSLYRLIVDFTEWRELAKEYEADGKEATLGSAEERLKTTLGYMQQAFDMIEAYLPVVLHYPSGGANIFDTLYNPWGIHPEGTVGSLQVVDRDFGGVAVDGGTDGGTGGSNAVDVTELIRQRRMSIQCRQIGCAGVMVDREDEIGPYLQCDICGVKSLAGGGGTPTLLVAPPPVRLVPVAERSMPQLSASRLQKMRASNSAPRGSKKVEREAHRAAAPSRPRRVEEKVVAVEVGAVLASPDYQEILSIVDRHKDIESNDRTASASVAVVSAVDAKIELAVDRLNEIIGIVESVAVLKREAQDIVRELRKVEKKSGSLMLPILPWIGIRNRADSKGRTYPQCAKCGRQFTNPMQYTGRSKRGEPCYCKGGCAGSEATDG